MLLDLTPKNLDLLEIKKDIESQPEVTSVHHIHAWALTTTKNIFSAHIKVTEGADKQKILANITELLNKKYNIYFSTTQIETICLDKDLGLKEIDFI